MGEMAEKWKANWGAHYSKYRSYYDRAAQCGGSGLEKMECAAGIMKEIKRDRLSSMGVG